MKPTSNPVQDLGSALKLCIINFHPDVRMLLQTAIFYASIRSGLSTNIFKNVFLNYQIRFYHKVKFQVDNVTFYIKIWKYGSRYNKNLLGQIVPISFSYFVLFFKQMAFSPDHHLNKGNESVNDCFYIRLGGGGGVDSKEG